jgi:hypothetical protein
VGIVSHNFTQSLFFLSNGRIKLGKGNSSKGMYVPRIDFALPRRSSLR